MNKEPRVVLSELHKKFSSNFDDWGSRPGHQLKKSFIGLQTIAAIGETLSSKQTSKHHSICCQIYDEVFSDGICSLYLASQAMDKPARIVLRRVFELGLAAIYLWDMPHAAYAWKKHDQGLNFTEMLKHLNSEGFAAHLKEENGAEIDGEFLLTSRCQKIYGSLSDIVHGKIATFETTLEKRFEFSQEDWEEFILLIDEIVEILVQAFLKRFQVSDLVFEKIPLANKRKARKDARHTVVLTSRFWPAFLRFFF